MRVAPTQIPSVASPKQGPSTVINRVTRAARGLAAGSAITLTRNPLSRSLEALFSENAAADRQREAQISESVGQRRKDLVDRNETLFSGPLSPKALAREMRSILKPYNPLRLLANDPAAEMRELVEKLRTNLAGEEEVVERLQAAKTAYVSRYKNSVDTDIWGHRCRSPGRSESGSRGPERAVLRG